MANTPAPLLPVADRGRPLPASHAQRGMWLAQEVAGHENRSLTAVHSYRLTGPLDLDALRTALDVLVARHEVLRTGFALREGELHQVIGAPAGLDTAVVDTAGDAELTALVRAVADTPFDLGRGPLLRVRLFRLDADTHVLCAVFHHIANDGWSMDVFHRELAALYGAAADLPGVSDPATLADLADLDELAVQYPDFAVWQHARAQDPGTHADALAYWRTRLADAPPLLLLPTDKPRADVRWGTGDRVGFRIPAETAERAAKAASAHGTTLFTFQYAAFQALLAAWSGQTDVVTGITTANRTLPETEPLIGFFVNVLPLRSAYRPAISFAGFLTETAASLIDAYRHEALPFELLLEHLDTPRAAGHNPLVQVTVASHQELTASLSLPGLGVEYLSPERLDVQEDMTLYLTSTEAGTRGDLDFRTDLFERSTVAALAEAYLRFMGLAAEDPTTTLGTLAARADLPGRAAGDPTPPRDRRAAGDPASPRDGRPAAAAPDSAPAGDDPLTSPTERLVAGVWQDILGCGPLGPEDVFFKNGGTSMAASLVANRLSEQFGPGVTVRARDVFLHSRLGALAARLDELAAETTAASGRGTAAGSAR
ncbi:condensation domain-containing protein [Streptomyces jumonjinensis]|uniref:condensation domain-containing protein n=2 Tax=Streptomyces jumonjinensis TaxID=1945 RepID=UPI00331FD6F6